MKINGIMLGSGLFFTGILIKNLDEYIKESIIGTIIIALMGLGCWYFAFDNMEQSSGDKK